MVWRVVSSSASKRRRNSLTVNVIRPVGVGWMSRSVAVATRGSALQAKEIRNDGHEGARGKEAEDAGERRPKAGADRHVSVGAYRRDRVGERV
jgi:hypothetical protein